MYWRKMSAENQFKLFSPGRLCLFGEHSDWAAQLGHHPGYCLVVGTDQGISATARTSDEFSVETMIPDAHGRPTGRKRQMSCPWDLPMLRQSARDRDEFFRYCAGVAGEMFDHPGVSGGIELRIRAMDLPLRKGVSSSAAVCILVARAFDAVYDLRLFPHELMEIAYRGERATGSQCGRMDQACIYGQTPVLLSFKSEDDTHVEPIFPADDVAMFFVDLAGRKDTVRILDDLRSAYAESEVLQAALGADNEAVLREAYEAVTRGDAKWIGGLMTRAQAMFDERVAPHSPQELASPLLHELLAMHALQEHIYGGKGVGSQGDGTAQFVARSPRSRDAAFEIISSAFPQMRCFPLNLKRHR
jgi:galactokinase